jgi:hypothetical protein
MKRIIISMLYLFALGLLFGAAIPGSVSKDRPLYASDRIKLKLSEQAIRSCSLPSPAYAETPSFQNSELDRLLSLSGGEAVIRAHIPAKDKDWEGDTGFDRWLSSASKPLATWKKYFLFLPKALCGSGLPGIFCLFASYPKR